MKQEHIPVPPMNLGAVLNLMEYLLCFKSIRDELKANLAMRLYVGRSSFTSREADEMADYILSMLKCCYFRDIIKEFEEWEQSIRIDERRKAISEIKKAYGTI